MKFPLADFPRGAVAAIGAFDGIHLGHRTLLDKTMVLARADGLTPLVITFDPLPRDYFRPDSVPEHILTCEEKSAYFAALGFSHCLVIPFTAELAAVSANDFARDLSAYCGLRELVMGDDFNIGHNREGNTKVISELGRKFDFRTHVLPKLKADGEDISSTRIRALLHEGKVREAGQLLGYDYSFENFVIQGEKRGRTLGFPTINQHFPEEKIHLPNGVYACMAELDGERFPAVCNIGVKPTFGRITEPIAETHLLQGGRDLYGQKVRVFFRDFLRPEIGFPSVATLKAQIAEDISAAERILQ